MRCTWCRKPLSASQAVVVRGEDGTVTGVWHRVHLKEERRQARVEVWEGGGGRYKAESPSVFEVGSDERGWADWRDPDTYEVEELLG